MNPPTILFTQTTPIYIVCRQHIPATISTHNRVGHIAEERIAPTYMNRHNRLLCTNSHAIVELIVSVHWKWFNQSHSFSHCLDIVIMSINKYYFCSFLSLMYDWYLTILGLLISWRLFNFPEITIYQRFRWYIMVSDKLIDFILRFDGHSRCRFWYLFNLMSID